jgi:ABC-type antimicrobial peptide transport system permease subunit
VLAFRVGRRRREFAIRLALGASPRRLRGLILRHAVALLVPATSIGLVGAAAAARWLQAQLFEVSPSDPVAFAAAAAIPLVVGLVAAYVPARSASLVDPIAALRAQ